MPPDPNPNQPPPPPGKPRRRPSPGVGGNWVWMVILLLLGLMFFASNLNSARRIEWFEFWSELKKENVRKFAFVDSERIDGEFRDLDKVPADVRKKLGDKGKFTVQRLRINYDDEF